MTFSTVCYVILCDIQQFSEPDWNHHCDLNLEDLTVQNFSASVTLRQMMCEYVKLLCEIFDRKHRPDETEREEGGRGRGSHRWRCF